MDEGQSKNPNTTYNVYKMEFWKFALTWKLIYPVQHKITQKEQKETTKKRGITLTIMGLQLNTLAPADTQSTARV